MQPLPPPPCRNQLWICCCGIEGGGGRGEGLRLVDEVWGPVMVGGCWKLNIRQRGFESRETVVLICGSAVAVE